MDDKIVDALKQYYELKNRYEEQVNRKKKQIINDKTLTQKQKRKKIIEIKKKCINCNKLGGTIFSNEKGVLRAVCGNQSTPCNLDIEIDRGMYYSVRTIYEEFSKDAEALREKIIRNKLDLLFNYKSESDIIENFELLRNEYSETESAVMRFKKKYMDVLNNELNKDKILIAKQELNNQISELNNLAKDFDETENMSLIREMVEKLNENISELAENIRVLSYKVNRIECDDYGKLPCKNNISYLVQKPYDLEDLEDDISREPRVIKNFK